MKKIGEPGWRATEVHPIATSFRVMTEEELEGLAADIKENGLHYPIMVDTEGKLVDGRNRQAACEKAGIEPKYQVLNGEDVSKLVVTLNLQRRDLSKGQKAIGLAMIYPEPDKRGRGNKGKASETDGFSQSRLKAARAILRHSRTLAEQVRDGAVFFDAALKTVSEAAAVSQTNETKMAELREQEPDLADLVSEERLKLDEAYATMKQRQAEAAAMEANKRETMLRLSETAWQSTTAWASADFVDAINERLEDKEFRELWLKRLRFDPDRFDDIQRGASSLAALIARVLKENEDV